MAVSAAAISLVSSAAQYNESTPVGETGSAAWSPLGDQLVIGYADGFVRVCDTTTGKLIGHRLLARTISRSGQNARPAFVSFSRGGKLVVAAGRWGDPVKFRNGLVAFYDDAGGCPIREVFEFFGEMDKD